MSKKGRAKKSTFPGKYTGELATPIYEPLPGGVGGLGGSKAEAERRVVEQRILKMEKLFDWYSIDPDEPDAGMCLAVKLALAHVPGMQVRHELRKRGRKRSWKDGLGIELVRDVDALQQTKKMNYEQAIKELRKNKKKPWQSLHASQPHHSPSRSTQGGTKSSAHRRTPKGVANFASHGDGVRGGSDRRKFKRSKLVGDENRPRDFCVGGARVLSGCSCR